MSWPDAKHRRLLRVIVNVKSQIHRTGKDDQDNASFQYEEGVLITANDARLLLEAMADLGEQALDGIQGAQVFQSINEILKRR